MSEKELFGFTPQEVDLIRKTVGKDAINEDEFRRFLYRANKLGLNPLDGTIHLQARNRKTPEGKWEKVNVIIIGIDGFRAVGDSTGKLAGIKRDVIRNEKGQLTHAWAEVYRSDWKEPAREVVSLREYVQVKDGHPISLWETKPETMLKKCAEAGAHRMAWASALAGIYIPEEMPEGEESGKNGKSKGKNDEPKTEPSRTEKPKGDTVEPPQTEQPKEVLKTELPKSETQKEQPEADPPKAEQPKTNPEKQPKQSGEQPPVEPFEGEVVIMDPPEAVKDGWKKLTAFAVVAEETVTLFNNEGLLDKLGSKDLVLIHGDKRGSNIKVKMVSVMQKADEGGEKSSEEPKNEAGKPSEEPKESKTESKDSVLKSGVFAITLKSAPAPAVKSGEDVIYARVEVNNETVLMVAREGYREILKTLSEGATVKINGRLVREGERKVLYFEGFVEASAA
ncbi:MAG: RecT family protein [Pelotomaculum sp. PtaB.Bin104]|nr:MAG: RecT family protein [Pelotomaculum sp. PtaB.Bin104]